MDYNIYLRSVTDNAVASPSGSGKTNSPTTPSSQKAQNNNTTPKKAISTAANIISSPDSLVSMAKSAGIGAVSKAIPVVGIVIAAIEVAAKIADQAIETSLSFTTPASGDYKFANDYRNFKRNFQNITHPFSTWINSERTQLYDNIQRRKNEEQSLLLGGTMLNSKYGRYL